MQETEAETKLATASTLWLLLQSTHGTEPFAVVVVGIYPSYAKTLSMAFALILTYLVFLKRKDVGIIIIYGGTYAVLQQPLDYCRRAWGTTGMEEHLVAVFRNDYRLAVGFL